MVTITLKLPSFGSGKKKTPPPPPPKPAHIRQASQENIVKRVHSGSYNNVYSKQGSSWQRGAASASASGYKRPVPKYKKPSASTNNVYSKQGSSWQRGGRNNYVPNNPSKSFVPSKPTTTPQRKLVKSRWGNKAGNSQADNSWVKAKPDHEASATTAWGRNTNNGTYSKERGKVYESDASNLAGKAQREMRETFAKLGTSSPSYAERSTPRSEQSYYRSNITNRKAPAPIPKSTGVRAWALYDFDASEAEEISLKKGDAIDVTNQDGSWWIGSVNGGKSGSFPSNYVTTDAPVSAPAPAAKRWVPPSQRTIQAGGNSLTGQRGVLRTFPWEK